MITGKLQNKKHLLWRLELKGILPLLQVKVKMDSILLVTVFLLWSFYFLWLLHSELLLNSPCLLPVDWLLYFFIVCVHAYHCIKAPECNGVYRIADFPWVKLSRISKFFIMALTGLENFPSTYTVRDFVFWINISHVLSSHILLSLITGSWWRECCSSKRQRKWESHWSY